MMPLKKLPSLGAAAALENREVEAGDDPAGVEPAGVDDGTVVTTTEVLTAGDDTAEVTAVTEPVGVGSED